MYTYLHTTHNPTYTIYIHTYLHTHICTYIHNLHTHISTYIRTQIKIYIYLSVCLSNYLSIHKYISKKYAHFSLIKKWTLHSQASLTHARIHTFSPQILFFKKWTLHSRALISACECVVLQSVDMKEKARRCSILIPSCFA